MLIGSALPLIAQHWLVAGLGIVAIVINYIDTFEEERSARQKFGAAYEHYAERMPLVTQEKTKGER